MKTNRSVPPDKCCVCGCDAMYHTDPMTGRQMPIFGWCRDCYERLSKVAARSRDDDERPERKLR